MKKVLAVAMLGVFCALSAFAGSKDDMFDELYRATAAQLPAGATASKDSDYRVMFINYPLDIHSRNGFNVIAAKRAIVQVIRGTKDAEYIRQSDALIIYNYITTDRKVFSVVISGEDL
jgi:hypothetical protein